MVKQGTIHILFSFSLLKQVLESVYGIKLHNLEFKLLFNINF